MGYVALSCHLSMPGFLVVKTVLDKVALVLSWRRFVLLVISLRRVLAVGVGLLVVALAFYLIVVVVVVGLDAVDVCLALLM